MDTRNVQNAVAHLFKTPTGILGSRQQLHVVQNADKSTGRSGRKDLLEA
jgi:hypothetical protein